MLEGILKKLQCSSIEEFFEREKEFWNRYRGLEIERDSPYAVLTDEELDYFENNILPAISRKPQ